LSSNWFLRDGAGGAIANEGQGNSGDSGAAVIRNGNIVGVFTNAWGDKMRNLFTNQAGDEGFKIGSEGLGVRMTQNYVNWLNQRCDLYTGVPEPASLVLLIVGLGFVRRSAFQARA
jgi:hypothetical protein